MNNKAVTRLTVILLIISINSIIGLYSSTSPMLQDITYSPDNSIDELSLLLSIPSSKLIEAMNLPAGTDRTVPVSTLDVNNDDIEAARTTFKAQIWGYSWNIVIIGMIVIFLSLALTGFLVGRLQFFVRENKKVTDVTKKLSGKPIPPPDKNRANIIAAIAALHLHIKEAEESDRMIIAWNREPVSVWKTSGKFLMPNKVREVQRQQRQP